MSKGDQPPSGITMMLKALGIQIDPAMFKTMADAVTEIRDRLRRIEEKTDALVASSTGAQAMLAAKNPSQLILVKGENDGADRNRTEVAGRTQG